MTRLTLGVTALCAALCCGCSTDGSWSMSRLLGWDDSPASRSAKMPKADLALCGRVETIGRKIIAQNTFTGIEPLFHTVGVPEAVLFHRGAEELIISEGLVKQCRNDSELAAVLSSELAQMMNEKKTARRVGRTEIPSRMWECQPAPVSPVARRLTPPARPSALPGEAAPSEHEPRNARSRRGRRRPDARCGLRPGRHRPHGECREAIRSRTGHQEANERLGSAPRWEW